MDEKQIAEIQQLFGSTIKIPGEFARWMADQFALAVPSIPISQLFGARTVERLIDAQTSSVTITGGTETEFYSLLLAGKSIAQNGCLKIVIPFTIQDSAPNGQCVLRVKINGTTVHSHQILAFLSTPDPEQMSVYIWGHDQYARQTVQTSWLYTKAWSPATVDLSVPFTVSVTFQNNGGGGSDVFIRKAAFASLYNPSDE